MLALFILIFSINVPADQLDFSAIQHPNLSDKVIKFMSDSLLPLTHNTTLYEEVICQNNKKTALSAIQQIDRLWIDAENELPIHREKLKNKCAKIIIAMVKKYPPLVEVFVMDNQGALVCMNNITSDYWQGDEAKWKNAYNNGKGGLDVGKIKFDKSAYTKLQQISLPIVNQDKKVVGAITFGIDINKL